MKKKPITGKIKLEQTSRCYLDLNIIVCLTLEIPVLHQALELILGWSYESYVKAGNRTGRTDDS